MGSPKMRRQKQAVRACTLFEDGLPRLPSKLGLGAETAVEMWFVDLHRLMHRVRREDRRQIGRAHVRTPVTNEHLVRQLLLRKKTDWTIHYHSHTIQQTKIK